MIFPFDLSLGSSSQSLNWLAVLAECTIKGVAVLALAGLLSVALRRVSAAFRHAVWAGALVALVALPVFSGLLPGWNVGLLPSISPLGVPGLEGERSQDFVAADLSEPSPAGGQLGSVAQAPATPKGFAPLLPMTGKREQLVSDQGPSRLWTWSTWSLLIWGAGALFLLASRGIGLLQVWRIKGRAKRIREPSWRALVAQLAAELGLGRRVTLLASDRSISPMSWGVWRPVILLPAAREEWSDPCRRVVLLHELAHIKRLDYVSQMLAQLARALYWFNPLVWLACRQLRIEREQACDDQVLAAGTKPSDYSTHLLEIARSIQLPRWGWQIAVAMARHSQIEGRLLAILDSRRSHGALSRRAQGLILLTVCLVVLPLATIGFTSGSTAAIRSTEAPPPPTPAATKESGPASAEGDQDKPIAGMVLRQVEEGGRVGEWGALSPNGHYLSLGYPFNRTGCRLRRWITLVLARTIRGPWASSRPGSAPMRTVLDYLEWL